MKSSISFIVIGKNESVTLGKCISAISKLRAEIEKSASCEVIYVDSGSNDDSVKIASGEDCVDGVYLLKGDVNAAVARNVGAEKASGDILCFLDADMVVCLDCFFDILEKIESGGEAFVSSDLMDIEHDGDWNVVGQRRRYGITEDRYEAVTGGFFLIKKNVWHSVGGMRNVFRRNQDLDLGLRLADQGVMLLRVNCVGVHHHTVSYVSPSRFFSDAFKGNLLYPGILIRKNLLNKYAHKYLYKSYASSLFLLSSLILLVTSADASLLLVYLGLWLVLTVKRSGTARGLPKSILMRLFFDVSFFAGFFCFFPGTALRKARAFEVHRV